MIDKYSIELEKTRNLIRETEIELSYKQRDEMNVSSLEKVLKEFRKIEKDLEIEQCWNNRESQYFVSIGTEEDMNLIDEYLGIDELYGKSNFGYEKIRKPNHSRVGNLSRLTSALNNPKSEKKCLKQEVSLTPNGNNNDFEYLNKHIIPSKCEGDRCYMSIHQDPTLKVIGVIPINPIRIVGNAPWGYRPSC